MSTIALVGNPNCGKTTLFNALTGSRQHVGNWPGVTVEKKVGKLKYQGKEAEIVDLPGTYSLGAYSEDEVVARNFIVVDKPDLVINVVDATNIERNLYLTTQLLEMDVNLVIALNMMDEAENRNINIDVKRLSSELGIPVIPVIATKKQGIDKLILTALDHTLKFKNNKKDIVYGSKLEAEINNLRDALEESAATTEYPAKWTAIKLLENDEYMLNFVKERDNHN